MTEFNDIKIKKTIWDKAKKVKEKQQYITDCLDSNICPKCGKEVIGEQVIMDGIDDDMSVTWKCDSCGFTMTEDSF